MKNPGIYILTSPSGKQYVGKDSNLPSRAKEHFSGKNPKCRLIHRAIKKYGRDAFSVEIIQYPGISDEALNAVERWKIKQIQTLAPKGYNLTEGGDGGKRSEETRQKMSKAAFQRVADGTHNFLGGDIPRRAQKKRVEEGKHNFLDGEISRLSNKKRLEDGIHHFLGTRNPVHKSVEDGTHHFIGKKNPVHKRVKDGTHHLLGGEVQRRAHKKRLKDGNTHSYFDRSGSIIANLAQRKYQIVYQYAVMIPKCYWHALNSVYLHRKLTREGFFDKDIPDTSNAEQIHIF